MTEQPTLFDAPIPVKGRCPICRQSTMWERLYDRHYRCMNCRAGIVGRD